MRHLPIPEQAPYLRLVLNYYHLLSTGCPACGGETSGIGRRLAAALRHDPRTHCRKIPEYELSLVRRLR
jgi:hypothetical protein